MNLNLRSNPVVDELGYLSLVLRALPLLAELDCNPVTTGQNISTYAWIGIIVFSSNCSVSTFLCKTLSYDNNKMLLT